MTDSPEDNKRIIEPLCDMLHEQHQTNVRLKSVDIRFESVEEEQRAMRLEIVKLNAKADGTIEAIEHLREAVISVAQKAVVSVETMAAFDRRLTVVEHCLGLSEKFTKINLLFLHKIKLYANNSKSPEC